MNRYVVESRHTPEQCLQTLDEFNDKEREFLSRFDFGCHSGQHVAFATLEGQNESDIRNMLPSTIRTAAQVYQVDKFTPEEIRSYHKDNR